MLEDVSTGVLISCLSAAASCLAGWAAYWMRHAIQTNRRETEAIRAGMRVLLRAQLVRLMMEAGERGWVSLRDAENVNLMRKAYEELGGNGLVEEIYKSFCHLPHVEPKGRR